MSKIFMNPKTLFKLVTEEKSKGLKVLYVGMGESAKESFYVKSIPSANLVDLNEITTSSPNP